MLSIIVAIAKNNVIGKDNKLIWHLPEDLKRFKLLTQEKIVVMGKKTWDSLQKKPLPNRLNIIISNKHYIHYCIFLLLIHTTSPFLHNITNFYFLRQNFPHI